MPMVRIERFGGMIPLQDDRLLADYHAALAQNVYVQSGRLGCFSALVPIHTMANPDYKSFFRIPIANPGINNMMNSYWLEFPLADTWVVRHPGSGLTDGGRFYWADGLFPPGYTTRARVVAGQPVLVLGIPAPEVAPGVTASGGSSSTTETRAYVYTWVSASGEEGPPSPPTVQPGKIDDTWTITFTPPTTGDTTDRTLTTLRIYRTVTSDQGVATFQFIDEVPISTTTYVDTVADDEAALNDPLGSTNYSGPPVHLKGLVSMPNGMIAGFQADEVWFCEPYRPHAWPPQYVIGVESPIVGLGVQGQTLVVMTIGWTYTITGISPDAMSMSKITNLNPCTAMGSIVSSEDGVMYTSTNGLMVVNAGTEVNATAQLVRKDQWTQLLYLMNLHAVYINKSYLAFSSPTLDPPFQPDTFQNDAFQQTDFTGSRDGLLISISDERTALTKMHTDTPVDNLIQDLWNGEIMALYNGVVFQIDLRKPSPRLSSYLWRSKVFQTPYKENWAAAKVFYTNPPAPADEPTYFRLYADGNLKLELVLPASGQQFRLPSGFKCDFMQFELEGQLEIYNVQIATSARELRNA